jgi:hypothetical protein
MERRRRVEESIEYRARGSEAVVYFSVAWYDYQLARARKAAVSEPSGPGEVYWTDGAPSVEEISTEWQETTDGRVRICDWDLYDAQMRVLIGLDPHSPYGPNLASCRLAELPRDIVNG